jgi:hypothetical protein
LVITYCVKNNENLQSSVFSSQLMRATNKIMSILNMIPKILLVVNIHSAHIY